MNASRPTPDEERWLDLAARLRGAVPRDVLSGRTGWRTTGTLARIALFVLGLVAAALVFAILGVDTGTTALAAGLIAATAAEWLKRSRLLHASGIEEGLCFAGFVLVAFWIADEARPLLREIESEWFWIVLACAAGAAGLRLLNPLLTTGAALAFMQWFASTHLARASGGADGGGMSAFVLACAAAAVALAAGSREFRRPSHDRMLDWLVVALPVSAYSQRLAWNVTALDSGESPGATGQLITCALLAALGVASLVAGIRRRRHGPLIAFLGCTACLAAELARATDWSAEAWLVIYGLGAIGAAAALDRHLRKPRDGITSARLTDREGPLDLLETVGATVLAQRVGAAPVPGEPELPRHEGRFGGGGASGQY